MHYFVAKKVVGVPADKPVVRLDAAYTRVPLLLGKPKGAKVALIAASAPLFWLMGSVGSVLLGMDLLNMQEMVGPVIVLGMALILGVPSFIMFVLHLVYAKTSNSDIYRVLFYLQERFAFKWNLTYPTNADMKPVVDWQIKAEELLQMQEILKETFDENTLEDGFFEQFHELGLVMPVEGMRRQTKEYYQEVLELGVETDLRQLFLAIQLSQVPEEHQDDFKEIQERLSQEEEQERETILMVSTLKSLYVEKNDLPRLNRRLSRNSNPLHEEIRIVLKVKNFDDKNWDKIKILNGAILLRNKFVLPYVTRFMPLHDFGYFENAVKGLFRILEPPASHIDEEIRRRRLELAFDVAV